MARDENLPFEVGDTYFGIGTGLATSTYGDDLEGRTYVITDRGTTRRPASNRKVTLRVVRNRSGARIGLGGYGATGNTAYRQLRVSTATGKYGRYVIGYGNAGKAQNDGHIIHDAYTTGIPNLDLFYVVDEGPVEVRLAGSVTVGQEVTFTTAGLARAATSSDVTHGRFEQSGSTDGTLRSIYVGRPNRR